MTVSYYLTIPCNTQCNTSNLESGGKKFSHLKNNFTFNLEMFHECKTSSDKELFNVQFYSFRILKKIK